MAIAKLKRKSGIVYRVRKVLPNGRRESRNFRTKIEAENYEAKLTLNPHSMINRRIRFQDFCKRFLEIETVTYLQHSSLAKYRGVINSHLAERFGNRYIDSITREECANFVAEICKADFSEHQKNTIVSTFKSLMRKAVDLDYLTKNPLAAIKPPRKPCGRNDFWTESEVMRFLNANVSSSRMPIYMLAFNTGMRLGEIFGLKWDCVDLEHGSITVKRIWCQKLGAIKETTKNKKSRTFGINESLVMYLKQMKIRSSSETVIDHRETGCKNSAHASREFQKDAKNAGMTKLIRFHDIRHTFVSNFMMNGGTELECRKIVGHSSSAQLDHYTHFSQEAKRRASSIVSFAPTETKIIKMGAWT